MGVQLTGTIFDIREFTVHDGPGIRTTVFMKGCPLRCAWCHNPEGISPLPQVMRSPASERMVGESYTPGQLAAILNGQAELLRRGGGGVTFSGGEPLLQAEFVAETIDSLQGVHIVLDTSGYASEEDFTLVAARCDLVYFDVKLIDPVAHERYTGHGNDAILRNLRLLPEIGAPFVARVPLVPGVTDTPANLRAIAETIAGLPGLVEAHLLPYNRLAGAKYASCGMEFAAPCDETRSPNVDTIPFHERGIPVRVM